MARLTLLALAALAAFALPAYADITVKSQDGTVELTLPNGWHEIKPQGQALIVAVDGRGARVAVRAYSKEDFKDMKAVAGFIVSQLKLVEVPEQAFQDVDVNGNPGVRLELKGTEPNGMKRGFIVTVFESGGQYIGVLGSANASAFAKDAPILDSLPKKLVFTNAPAAAPTASNPASAPQPKPPARH
jgi:hypothetical protein